MIRLHKFYTYRMTSDTGFAPNPFGDYCTLATCMVKLRASKNVKPGTWIIGIGGKNTPIRDKLIYAMRISEILPIEVYWDHPKFRSKRPDHSSSNQEEWVGDNIYHREQDKWIQEPSLHSNSNGTQNKKKTRHDVETGKRVLISDHFYYFGENALDIPSQLEKETKARLKCDYSEAFIQKFLKWLRQRPLGIHGKPLMLPKQALFKLEGNFPKCECKSD